MLLPSVTSTHYCAYIGFKYHSISDRLVLVNNSNLKENSKAKSKFSSGAADRVVDSGPLYLLSQVRLGAEKV